MQLHPSRAQVGHFQLLDELTFVQRSACSSGKVDEERLRVLIAQVLLFWLEGVARSEKNIVRIETECRDASVECAVFF